MDAVRITFGMLESCFQTHAEAKLIPHGEMNGQSVRYHAYRDQIVIIGSQGGVVHLNRGEMAAYKDGRVWGPVASVPA